MNNALYYNENPKTLNEEEVVMASRRKQTIDDYTDLCCTPAIRPLKWIKDKNGYSWLCDSNVNASGDIRKQNCWRCDEMAFPAGGR